MAILPPAERPNKVQLVFSVKLNASIKQLLTYLVIRLSNSSLFSTLLNLLFGSLQSPRLNQSQHLPLNNFVIH